MSKRKALGIGLGVGVALGFFVRPSVVRPTGWTEAEIELLIARQGPKMQREQPMPPTWRLVGQSRVSLVDPHGDYYGAWLEGVDFRRADLREADLSWATIRRCDFRGAHLENADLMDATFDARTHWPEGFDPEEHGASPATD